MGSDWERDLAEARVEQAAEERRRTRRELDLLAAEATWDEMLVATVGGAATVWCASGGPHRGVVESVGDELVTVRSGGATVVLARGAVVGVSPEGGPARGPASSGHSVRMPDMLAELADQGTPISVRADGTLLRGVVSSVGEDVVALRRDGEVTAYLAVRSVTEVRVDASSS